MAINSSDERLEPTPMWPEAEDYGQLIDDYSHLAPPAEGELLRGTVLSVTLTEVIVDIGFKSEGIVPISQVTQPDGSVSVKPGDEIDVMIDRHGQQIGRGKQFYTVGKTQPFLRPDLFGDLL